MNKIIQALAEHEKLLQELPPINKAIGAAINACELPIVERFEFGMTKRDEDEKGRPKTHLWVAFNEMESPHTYEPTRLNDDEVGEYLKEEGCQHCIETWRLIGVRKRLRKRLGIAKRNIRMFGKQAIKQLESEK